MYYDLRLCHLFLQILGYEKPLRITVSPKNLTLKEGEQALFRCQSSVPVPLRWSTNSNGVFTSDFQPFKFNHSRV